MSLFNIATRGVDLDALPEDDAPRSLIDFGPAPAPGARGTMPAQYNDLFDAAASEYGIDPSILKGIAYAESRFRPDIIDGTTKSSAGATGLMQFMPATAREMGINPLDPVESVFGAAAYLRQSLDKFDGDVEKAVASYNFGRNRDLYSKSDWHKGLPTETRNYVGTVLEFADGLAPAAAPAGGKAIPLPEGVAPSAAGGGRGMVNPEPGVNYAQQITPKRNEFAPLDEAARGVKTGITGLKQMWESNAVLKDATLAANMQERLDAFDRIDAGAKDVPRAIGLAYQQAGPEERQRLRGVVQKELGNRREFLDASLATIKQYQADMQRTKGRVTDFTDIEGVKDFTNWLAFNGGSGAASMAPLIVAAVTTGPLAPVAAGVVGYGMATGELNNDRIEYAQKQGLDNRGVADYVADKRGSTLGAAIPFAGLDVVAGPVGSVVKTATKGGVKELQRMGVKQGLKEIGKDTAEEAVTGGLQEMIKLGTGYGLDETQELLTRENAKKVLNSAAAEAAGGLTGGAARVSGTALVQQVRTPRVEDQPTTPQAPTVTAQPAAVPEAPVIDAAPAGQPAAPAGSNWAAVAAAEKQAQAEQAVMEKAGALQAQATRPSDAASTQAVDNIGALMGATPAPAAAAPQAVPTIEQAEQQLAARETPAQAAPVEMQMRPTGTLLVKGDAPALRARLAAAGVDNTITVDGGLIVSRSQAAKAQQALSAPPQQPAAATQQEAANVQPAQAPAAQPAAQATTAAAPDIARTDAPVPAPGVPTAGTTAPQAPDVAAPTEQYSKGMSPELAAAIMAVKPAPRATVESVNQALREVVPTDQPLPSGLGKVVVATAKDIKAQWEPLIGRVDINSENAGRAQGFYVPSRTGDPSGGTVFIVADNIRPGEEKGVIAHELMHKHGQAVLGKEGWDRLHSTLGGWAGAQEGSQERQVYDEAAARVEAAGADLSNQELFPYAVQVATEMGIKPSIGAPLGTVSRWLYQVRLGLQQAWSRITGKPEGFKTQDLVNLAFGIAQRENPQHRGELDNATQEAPAEAPAPVETQDQAQEAQEVEPVEAEATEPAAADDVDMMFSRSSIESSMGQMTPDQERAWTKAAGLKKPPTIKERAAQMKANLSTKLRQGIVDQFAPIADLDQKAYMLARMSKGADGTVEAALLYGRPFLRDGVPDVDVNEGGFAKVLAGLKGEHDRFLWWVAALRAENLKAQGKENLLDTPDIDALKTLNQGLMADGTDRQMTYAEALLELNDYNNAVLKMAQESGLIDQAAVDLFRDQPYVPFYRMQDENGQMQGPRFSAGLTNQKAWKKLKGGTEQINADLLQNMLMNWSSLYQAAARNRAALATMDAAEQLAVAYPVPEGTKGAVKVMRDGITEHWAIEDPYLLEAISALHYTPSTLMKVLAKPKQLLTWGVTVNPTFKIRNLIRDSVSAIAQSNLSYNVAGNVWKGWKLTASDSQVYASMLASGGVIKFGTQENTDHLRAKVEKLGGTMLTKPVWKKLLTSSKVAYDVYNEYGDRAENVNRTALYDRLIKKGYNHAEASFMARDLMDFSMGGNWALVRFFTQTVPFLNARLQGLYKLGRAANEDPARFAAVVGAVSMASLALLAMYHDDDDWKKREDWDRDAYWWFKIGDKAYRIPKPFEVGALGTLAERTAELMMSKEMDAKRFGERIRHMMASTFSMDPVMQAVKPLMDIYANKDSFTGRAIETDADQKLRPEDRYGERTPEIARLLGSWGLPDPLRLMKGDYAKMSPKQIEHLLRGYFSWVATVGFTLSDIAARPLLDRGERPDMRLKDVFLAGNFVETLPASGSRYVSKMYDQVKEANQAYASYQAAVKAGDKEKAQEIRTSDLDKLKNHERLQDGSKALARINVYAKMVEASKTMTGEEKRKRLDELDQQRHKIAKTVTSSPGR